MLHRIKEFRESKPKITQAKIAKKIGMSQGGYALIELGLRDVKIATARKIVKALNDYKIKCDLDDVFPIEK